MMVIEKKLSKFDEDGIVAPEGQCWVNGDYCSRRFNFKNCQGCEIRAEHYRLKGPSIQEDSQYCIKPKKTKRS